jgi:hypothetical protein
MNENDYCRVCGGYGKHRDLDGQPCPRQVDQKLAEGVSA